MSNRGGRFGPGLTVSEYRFPDDASVHTTLSRREVFIGGGRGACSGRILGGTGSGMENCTWRRRPEGWVDLGCEGGIDLRRSGISGMSGSPVDIKSRPPSERYHD